MEIALTFLLSLVSMNWSGWNEYLTTLARSLCRGRCGERGSFVCVICMVCYCSISNWELVPKPGSVNVVHEQVLQSITCEHSSLLINFHSLVICH